MTTHYFSTALFPNNMEIKLIVTPNTAFTPYSPPSAEMQTLMLWDILFLTARGGNSTQGRCTHKTKVAT